MAAVTANLWGQDGYPIDSDGKPISIASYICEYRRGWKFVMRNPARLRSMVRVSRLSGSKPPWPKYQSFVTSAVAPLPVVNICRDGHFYPELGRYYAASGAELLIHPTATGGNPWYRETRIGSYTEYQSFVTSAVAPLPVPLVSSAEPVA